VRGVRSGRSVKKAGRGGSTAGSLQSVRGTADGRTRVTARHAALLRRWPALLRLTAPVAPIRFRAPPPRFAVASVLGSSRAALSARYRTRNQRTCAWLVLEVSGLPPRPSRPEGPRRDRSPGISLPTAHASPGDPVVPGFPRPGIFRPRGLATPSTACSPPGRTTIRQSPRRPWDFSFRVLLLPAGGTPFGASPLLSFLRTARTGPGPKGPSRPVSVRARLQRLTPTGKGPDRQRAEARWSAQVLPSWSSPLQGFLLRRLGTGFPARSPSCPWIGSAPYVPLPAEASGVYASGASGWPLSRLPALLGFRTFRTRRVLGRPPDLAYGFTSAWNRLAGSRGLFGSGGDARPEFRVRSISVLRLNPTPDTDCFSTIARTPAVRDLVRSVHVSLEQDRCPLPDRLGISRLIHSLCTSAPAPGAEAPRLLHNPFFFDGWITAFTDSAPVSYTRAQALAKSRRRRDFARA